MSSAADPLSSAATPSPSLLHLCRSTLDLLHAAVAVGSKVIRDLLLLGNNTLRLTQLLVLWRRGVEIQNSIQLTQYYSTIHTVHSHLQKNHFGKKTSLHRTLKIGYIHKPKEKYLPDGPHFTTIKTALFFKCSPSRLQYVCICSLVI